MQTFAEIQTAIDKLPGMMAAKGLIKPAAEFGIRANDQMQVCLHWNRVGGTGYDKHYEWFKGDSPEQIIAKTHDYLAALPSPEERHRAAFLKLAGTAADYAAEHLPDDEISAEVRATIVAGMQRISENIITDQRGL